MKRTLLSLFVLLAACDADRPLPIPYSQGDSAAGTPSATVQFLSGFQQKQRGALVEGRTLVVEYELWRMPQCIGSTYNGYAAWNTQVSVRFLPGGELFQGGLKGSHDTYGHDWYSMPFEVEIPAGAREAQLWFYTSGRNCTGAWDSNFGQNYRFEVLPANEAPNAPGWAGDWGNGFSRECVHRDGLAEPEVIDSWRWQRACLWVDAEVWVPALTDWGEEHPERVQAQVVWRFDDGVENVTWLDYAGRDGNNYRWKWVLPRVEMGNTQWSTMTYRFRFSTDGAAWHEIGPRTITRAF